MQERLARPQNWKEMCKVTMSNTRVITSQSISTAGDWAATTALTRGTAFDPTDVAEVADLLTISTGHHVTTYFDFGDLAQSPWTTEKEIWGRAGERIGERIEIEVLAQHASWRNLGNSAGIWADDTDVVLAASAANVDDLSALIRRVIRAQNGATLMDRYGVGAVVGPTTFSFLELFAMANGFASADEALKNGLAPQIKYLGINWYVSNDNAADHAFAGVRKIQRLGLLTGTFGRMHKFPGIAGTSGGIQSGIAFHTRVDLGHLTPTDHALLVYDVRDDNS
jgi:hypothetical protein